MDDSKREKVTLFSCRDCQAEFPNQESLSEHRIFLHLFTTEPNIPQNAPFVDTGSNSNIPQFFPPAQSFLAEVDCAIYRERETYFQTDCLNQEPLSKSTVSCGPSQPSTSRPELSTKTPVGGTDSKSNPSRSFSVQSILADDSKFRKRKAFPKDEYPNEECVSERTISGNPQPSVTKSDPSRKAGDTDSKSNPSQPISVLTDTGTSKFRKRKAFLKDEECLCSISVGNMGPSSTKSDPSRKTEDMDSKSNPSASFSVRSILADADTGASHKDKLLNQECPSGRTIPDEPAPQSSSTKPEHAPVDDTDSRSNLLRSLSVIVSDADAATRRKREAYELVVAVSREAKQHADALNSIGLQKDELQAMQSEARGRLSSAAQSKASRSDRFIYETRLKHAKQALELLQRREERVYTEVRKAILKQAAALGKLLEAMSEERSVFKMAVSLFSLQVESVAPGAGNSEDVGRE